LCSCWAATRIGADCLIRSYTVIENCTLGNNVLVRQSCVLAESTVGDGAKIGPFAHLRPGSEIGEAPTWATSSRPRRPSWARAPRPTTSPTWATPRSARANIGAGVITCNYDGVHKHPTRIGKGVFVGSDSTLVAPVASGWGLHRRRLLHHQGRARRAGSVAAP
jgi:bifunctional UDP-N-acetylglucosamine pyrophosphorylase / glucosamine-1-phosphate N-acetyltransferase